MDAVLPLECLVEGEVVKQGPKEITGSLVCSCILVRFRSFIVVEIHDRCKPK